MHVQDKATPAFEDEDEDDDEDDDDIYSLLVKKPAALSPKANNKTVRPSLSLEDLETMCLTRCSSSRRPTSTSRSTRTRTTSCSRRARPSLCVSFLSSFASGCRTDHRRPQQALQEAVVESDEDVNDDEPAPMAEMATVRPAPCSRALTTPTDVADWARLVMQVNDQFFVRYDSDEEEAHPAPKDKAASAHAVQAKELTVRPSLSLQPLPAAQLTEVSLATQIDKQAVPLGQMGSEVLAALLQRTAAHAKDQPPAGREGACASLPLARPTCTCTIRTEPH